MKLIKVIQNILLEQSKRDLSSAIKKLLDTTIVSSYEDVCRIEVTPPHKRKNSEFYKVKVFFIGENETSKWLKKHKLFAVDNLVIEKIWETVNEFFNISVDVFSEKVTSCDDKIHENKRHTKLLKESKKLSFLSKFIDETFDELEMNRLEDVSTNHFLWYDGGNLIFEKNSWGNLFIFDCDTYRDLRKKVSNFLSISSEEFIEFWQTYLNEKYKKQFEDCPIRKINHTDCDDREKDFEDLGENVTSIKQLIGLLTETRKGLFSWMKSYLPNTPDYVIRDLMYRNAKEFNDERSVEEIKNWLDENFVNMEWEFQTDFPMSLDIFDDDTKQALEEKIQGVMHTGQDTERHQTQSELLKNKGISEEPIILYLKKDGKYTLGEGWHRTTQAFKLFPEGFIQPKVYIGLYPKWLE